MYEFVKNDSFVEYTKEFEKAIDSGNKHYATTIGNKLDKLLKSMQA